MRGRHVDHIRSYYEALNTRRSPRRIVRALHRGRWIHYYTRLGPHEGAETIGGYAALAVRHRRPVVHRERDRAGRPGRDRVDDDWRDPDGERASTAAPVVPDPHGKIAKVRAYHDGGKKNPQGDLLASTTRAAATRCWRLEGSCELR